MRKNSCLQWHCKFKVRISKSLPFLLAIPLMIFGEPGTLQSDPTVIPDQCSSSFVKTT